MAEPPTAFLVTLLGVAGVKGTAYFCKDCQTPPAPQHLHDGHHPGGVLRVDGQLLGAGQGVDLPLQQQALAHVVEQGFCLQMVDTGHNSSNAKFHLHCHC